MPYARRAIVSESLDSKQSNMAFDWLMALLKSGSGPLDRTDHPSDSTLDYWVSGEIGLGEGGLEWYMDPKSGADVLIVGLGNDLQVCYSRQTFQRHTQILFSAPTAVNEGDQVDYWSKHLIELYCIYQDNLKSAA